MPGWITAFKVIPWTDVIAAAPTVARGARKLWTAVKNRGSEGAVESRPQGTEERLQALEAQVEELRKELDASSELIDSLAAQNARLVEAVGVLRLRTRVLLWTCFVALALLAGLVSWTGLS